jgi:lipoprotein NlpI
MQRAAMKRVLPALVANLLLVFSPVAATAADANGTPLLDYASSLDFDAPPNAEIFRKRAARAEHQLERNPVPDEGCARTLGARRFAGLLNELGSARESLGDSQGAIDAYTKALACSPRAAFLHADLASELMHAGRFIEARQTAQQGLAIDAEHLYLITVLAQIDFVEGKWSDAIERMRSAVLATPDDEQAAYWQLFLWLAQRRSGIARPELAERDFTDSWPRPVLDTLQGALTEQELLEEVKDEADEARRREILCEALYYIGENRLASGDVETAVRYFEAAADVKVPYFIEHHMALAELEKVRR